MRLSAAARVMDASLSGEDVRFRGCAIDSRGLEPGMLFVALKGERADGHDFLDEAGQRGASAALVDRDAPASLPTLRVADSRHALGALANAWRRRFATPVLAVTGSNGKTTVKEMLAAILSREGPLLATRGNLNNDLGMPLTLTGLAAEHRYAVLEMGANHPGEIARLAAIAEPDIGIVTQCAPAHLEGFGSLDGVANTKGELFAGLAVNGVAIINADDPYAARWRNMAGLRRVITFGLEHAADVSADWRSLGEVSEMTLHSPEGDIPLILPLPGRHNVMNALAASAAALAAGIGSAAISAGLASMGPVKGRLQIRSGARGERLIDDTYNANPASLSAGLAVLEGYPGPRWLVLGDMAELGDSALALHREAGLAARGMGLDRLYTLGTLSREAAAAFGAGARHFSDRQTLLATLREQLDASVTLLIKGSRSMRMDELVKVLAGEGKD